MATCNRILQLTNYNIGSIATASLLPLGIVTRKLANECLCKDTFVVSTNTNNVVYVNEPGFYKITYTASLTAAAEGNLVAQLQLNGVTYQTSTTAAGAGDTHNITLSFETRVTCNVPILIGIVNNGVAITGGSGNLTIVKNGK